MLFSGNMQFTDSFRSFQAWTCILPQSHVLFAKYDTLTCHVTAFKMLHRRLCVYVTVYYFRAPAHGSCKSRTIPGPSWRRCHVESVALAEGQGNRPIYRSTGVLPFPNTRPEN